MTSAQKKSKLDAKVRRAAAILEEHFATLSPEAEAKARKALHQLAIAVSRRGRGKASRVRRSAVNRRSRRSRASTA